MNAQWLCAWCLANAAIAQDVAWTSPTIEFLRIMPTEGFVKAAGDIDGDGYQDAMVRADGIAIANRGMWGNLLVLSGRDGRLLQTLVGPTPTSLFLDFDDAGDFDRDGVPDILTCEQDQYGPIFWNRPWSEIFVHSGRNGKVLAAFPMVGGWDIVLGGLDLDADGKSDVVVATGHNGALGGGEVRAYGNDGRILYRLLGSQTGSLALTVGRCLERLGDIDGDGVEDFVTGCWEPTGRGAGAVVSGRSGAILRVDYGELPGDVVGYSAAAMGDLDADGVSDYALGNGGPLSRARSVIQVYSGANGARLWQKTDPYGSYGVHIASGDFDGDGLQDLIAGSPWTPHPVMGRGVVYAYSGRDGAILHTIWSWLYPPQPPFTSWNLSAAIGAFLCSLRTRDGPDHIVLGDNGERVYVVTSLMIANSPYIHRTGMVKALSGLPSTVRVLGPACAGNLPEPPRIGMRRQGAGVRVHLSSAPRGAPAVLMLGWSTTQFAGVTLPAALDPLGMPGCMLRTAIDHVHLAVAGSSGAASGYASVDLPVPAPLGVAGTLTPVAQWLVLGNPPQPLLGGVSEAITWR